jgi:hypothetical protein
MFSLGKRGSISSLNPHQNPRPEGARKHSPRVYPEFTLGVMF